MTIPARTNQAIIAAVLCLAIVASLRLLAGERTALPGGKGPELSATPDDPAPFAFPEIKPMDSDGLNTFFTERQHLVWASTEDTPKVRLHKAKLRLAVQTFHYNFQLSTSDRYDPRVLPDMERAVQDVTDAATVLWTAEADRRPWLEMLVGVQGEMEQLVMARARAGTGPSLDAGPVLNRDVAAAQSARLDAELALLQLEPKK